MEEYTLVVLAAGLGSRFGGLKQTTPVGPNGEFIIDYSIYDAIKAGFNKVVFIIRKEHESLFRESIGARIDGKIKVEYAFQDVKDVPEGYVVPDSRTKPWGTGQAIYAAREFVKGPFAIINADDFYGAEAFEILMDFLKNNETRNHYLTVCYKVKNTLSVNGAVKRGIVYTKNGVLETIVESSIDVENGKMIAKPLDGSSAFKVDDDTLTAVNLFGFTSNFMRTLQNGFALFLDDNIDSPDAEYLVPEVINDEIKKENISVYVRSTTSKWYGFTYKEDKDLVVQAVNNYITEGRYPKNLWE